MNKLKDKKITIGETYKSPFLNEIGVYQDGTVPFCRDAAGRLWAIAGHSHADHIGMFCGSDLSDMKQVYPISLNFCVGHADYAFSGIRYPEGVKARGSVWPFGLYICPVTNRFFCFFHNESGWNGKGTAYDAQGLCETPKADSDFRHVGLMHSDNEGRDWTFDRWVLTAETVCFSERFNPDGVNVLGQKGGVIKLGSGDFSLYPADDGFLYLFYNIISIDIDKWEWTGCDVYVARTRKREDGIMGDFVKYYDGAFCEAGNFGKETPIVRNAWHARVAYSDLLQCWLMTSSPINFGNTKQICADYMEMRTSSDLLHWSEPVSLEKDGKKFGNHYHAAISLHGAGDPYKITGSEFTVLTCHNGTDVLANDMKIETKAR